MTDRHSLSAQLKGIGRFIGFVYPQARRKIWVAIALLVVASLTEGASILLLVPLLTLLTPGLEVLSLPLPAGLADLLGVSVLSISLVGVLVGLVLVVIAQALLARLSGLIVIDAVLTITDRLRLSLFGSIALARWSHLVGSRHADLNHAVTANIDRIQGILHNLFLLAQGLIMLGVYTLISFLISPAMTLFACALGVVFLGILHPIRRYASKYGERISTQKQDQYRTIGEFLGGLKLVKSLNAESRYIKYFWGNVQHISREMRKYSRISAIPTLLFQILSVLSAAVFVYIAIRHLDLPLERVAVLLFILMRIAPRFTALQNSLQQILLNIGAYASTRSLILTSVEHQEPRSGPAHAMSLNQAIVFEDVEFTYTGASKPALSSISFAAPAGRITALIGPSGGGKSTIADLMMGLMEPQKGRVVIDGEALTDANRPAWRTHVAYVPQEVFLTHDTIAANLRLTVPRADEAALWRALEQAQAAEFVERLPAGLHTVVGERGTRLSGGERQRISLARALLRHPRLLILDEATSALDWENQSLIAQAIKGLRGAMTIVTIAHRPSMIAFADQVVAIEAGRVVETGDFHEVLSRLDSRLARMMHGERLAAPDSAGKTAQAGAHPLPSGPDEPAAHFSTSQLGQG